jgi:hypothetical protein
MASHLLMTRAMGDLRGLIVAFASALAANAFVAGCGSSKSGGSAQTTPTVPTARFTLSGDTPPNYLDVPFPSDAYLANGKIVDPLPGLDALIRINTQFFTHELGKMNGFSRTGLASFYVDDFSQPLDDGGDPVYAQIDPASLPANEDACMADASSVFLVDLAASDPSKARLPCRALIHDDTLRLSKTRPVLSAGPARGVVLVEGHRYAVVLTSRIKTTAGMNVAPSADFTNVASGQRAGSIATMYGSAIDAVNAALGSALASDGAKLIAIAPYTTMANTGEMFALRESLDAMPAPALKWDAASMAPMGAVRFAAPVNATLPAGFTASLDDWLGVATQKLPDGHDDPDFTLPVRAHDAIAALGTAVFQAANFLTGKLGDYGTLDDQTFTYDASGHVVPAPDRPTTPVWIGIAVPKAPMPASGYPCVIVQHGAGGSRSDLFVALANVFAAKGWMSVAIDGVAQGARAPEAMYQVDTVTDWQGAPGARYAGPDGFADRLDSSNKPVASTTGSVNGQLDLFAQGLNLGAVRDQIREMQIDIAQVARLLASAPDLSPLQTGAAPPKVDATKLAYVGGSMGSEVGMVSAAIEPNVGLWALNVGGGGLISEDGIFAPAEGSLLGLGVAANFALPGDFFDAGHPVATLGQTVVDPADPINYASYLVTAPGSIHGKPIAPRNIVATQVLYDASVAGEIAESWARAAGIGLATPNVGSNSGVRTLDEVRDPTKVPDRVPLPDVNPDGSGLIHDTPVQGVTAVAVQTGPGTHYVNLIQSHAHVTFPIPYSSSTSALDASAQFDVRCSYVAQQAMMTRFFADGFAGTVPNVTGFQPPVRDFDDDGNPDATDPDPSNPQVK